MSHVSSTSIPKLASHLKRFAMWCRAFLQFHQFVITALLAGTLMSARLPAAEPVIVAVGRGPEAPKQPQITASGDGTVYGVYGVGEGVFYWKQSAMGLQPATPAKAFEVPNMSLGMRRGPRIALSRQTVVVSAIGGVMGKGRDGDLIAWRSSDDGLTWNGPVQVNDRKDSAREGLHAMAASEDGTLWCVWLDLRDGKTELFAAHSSDAGETWSPNRRIYQSPDGSICECCHPSIAIRGTDVHVMFRNSIAGKRDMYLLSSRDGGQTFAPAVPLGREQWTLDACPMDGGMLAVDSSGNVNTAWRRDRVVFTASAERKTERSLGTGQNPWMTCHDDNAIVAWTTGRKGDLMVQSHQFETPRRLSQDARDPVLATSANGSGPLLCCWEREQDGRTEIVIQEISHLIRPADEQGCGQATSESSP
jgi:hypothetical protein